MRHRNGLPVIVAAAVAALAPAFAAAEPIDGVGECGTVLRPEDAPFVRALQAAGLYAAEPPLRASEPWIVPLTFHMVRRSNGTGGLAEANLVACLDDANALYAPMGVRFVRPLPTRFINSDAFYFNINTQAEIDALRNTSRVCGTINVYFTQNLAVEDGQGGTTTLCGQSSFTWNPVQGVVIANSCTGTGSNDNTTFSHELGHYFNLLHTHETAYGAECVDGSNCDEAGDLICDTPADPTLSSSNMDDNCTYIGTAMGPCNNAPYSPQTWNMMSYARPRTCRTAFTNTQNAVAAATLEIVRLDQWSPDACGGCTMLVFADSNAGATQTGSQDMPFAEVADALDEVCDGGMVMLRPGAYHETPILIDRPVRLRSLGGIARIAP